MIYRREFPNNPCKRYRTTVLNPLGSNVSKKYFIKVHQRLTGKHAGTKVCLRRKKSVYQTKFNLNYGCAVNNKGFISSISLARRYKTFAGLITYSNGSIGSFPLFNGASINYVVKTIRYFENPKIYIFPKFRAGDYAPVAYLPIMTCFFNISSSLTEHVWYCKASGTFCTMIRINSDRGYCTVKIPSNRYMIVVESSYVMLGRNSNVLPKGIWIGKAGINIKNGFRPTVRGVAKNPVDHPHGGRTKTNSPERTPWGRVAKFNK